MFTSGAYSAVDLCSGWNAVGYMSIDILDDLTFSLTRNGDISVTAVHFETHFCVNWRACCKGKRGRNDGVFNCSHVALEEDIILCWT